MKHVFKILKKHIPMILTILVLLFLQAMCDLALPDYTSKIVNVGIQQSGIEDTTLKIMSEDTFNKILSFSENKEILLDNYELANKNNIKDLEKFVDYKNNKLYVLTTTNQNKINKINESIIKPLLMVSLSQDKKITQEIPMEKYQKQYEALLENDSLLDQVIINSIKIEYQKINFDLNKLQMNYLLITGSKMLGLALLAMILAILVTYFAARIAAYFSRNMRHLTVNKVMTFSHKELKEFGLASLITRSTNDIQQVQILLVMLLRVVIYAPILGLGALSKVTNSSMSWIIGVALLAILSLVIVLFGLAMPKFKIMQKLIDKLNLVSREILTGLPVIRAFANEKHEEKRFEKANKDLMKTNLFVTKVMAIMMPIMMFIMNGVSILIVWVGSYKVDLGTVQVGDLIAFITYTMQIIISFLMISLVSIMLPRAIISLKRINEILDTDVVIKDSKKAVKFNKKGEIEFKNVSFKYPDADSNVLENINFKVKPNTTTAFIGSTGSGKSTLVNLIMRFFDTTEGTILIDGVDIKEIPLKVLYNKMGYVPQKGALFSGTIKSNITFGNNNLTDKEITSIAKTSQAYEFIKELDLKFDSPISQNGTNISGGQKQRLSIARAIAVNPEFYVFDDSFSALDLATDKKLREALKKNTNKSTVLIVAQRISTILNADQIVVLDNGKIVGIGKHEDLLKSCDVYKEIALSQLSKEELENA